jgi:hypothetical protein
MDLVEISRSFTYLMAEPSPKGIIHTKAAVLRLSETNICRVFRQLRGIA